MHEHNIEWQSTIGYVAQAIYLTDDTIRRNVAFGIAENDIDDVALERALKSAQLWDFVQGLPDKTHSIVGERRKISQWSEVIGISHLGGFRSTGKQ